MTIIGVCGPPASGKDTVADFFVSKGFTHISLSDILREEMRKQNIPLDREHIYNFSLEVKREHGLNHLAQLAADKIKEDTIISSIRAGSEVKLLRQRFGDAFTLISIEAPFETRYERATKRNRPGDDISSELFKAQEDRESDGRTAAHQVDKVIAMADRTIDNSASKQKLFDRLGKVLTELQEKELIK